MKYINLIVLVFFTIPAKSQKAVYTKVEGTHCSIVLPDGFEASPDSGLFINKNAPASILVSELSVPFYEMKKQLTYEGIQSRGLTFKFQRSVNFSNGEGTFIVTEQEMDEKKFINYLLAVGDSSMTIFVTGSCLHGNKNMESSIKESLLSFIYIPTGEARPFFKLQPEWKIIAYNKKEGRSWYINSMLINKSDSLIITQIYHALDDNKLDSYRKGIMTQRKKMNIGIIDELKDYQTTHYQVEVNCITKNMVIREIRHLNSKGDLIQSLSVPELFQDKLPPGVVESAIRNTCLFFKTPYF